jgi:hypothetical protein
MFLIHRRRRVHVCVDLHVPFTYPTHHPNVPCEYYKSHDVAHISARQARAFH